ncbi:MAG: hypothetical protein JWM05_953, partial [Acidimicrobiales bacterium]|nr:hypothetical protein [Acidimicrobiales bacterium]
MSGFRAYETAATGAYAPLDLLLALRDLRRQAAAEAAAGRWLDACLLTAAAGQVVEDALHRSRSTLDRAAEHLPGGHPAARRAL